MVHRLHPEWGVGVVLRKRGPGMLVRFERSHTTDGQHWTDEYICGQGHLYPVGELTEVQLHDLQEGLNVLRTLKKTEERGRVYEKMDTDTVG